jgi:hypothetical protein
MPSSYGRSNAIAALPILLLSLLCSLPHPAFAALSIDGSANTAATGGSGGTVKLSTTKTNDVIVLHVFNEKAASGAPATVSSITDSPYDLTWNLRSATTSPSMLANFDKTGTDSEVWWAVATSTLTNDVITVHWGGAFDCDAQVAFGVNGANTASPWDTNASLPPYAISVAGGSATTPTVSGVSTTNATTMLLGFMETPNYGEDNNGAAFTAPRIM